jgi:hypothetical protein
MNIREENTLIWQIGQRAEMMFAKHGADVMGAYIASEVKIVHNEICKLRLQELLVADEGNFAHDICGIHANIDILDGSFRNGFSPRFAAM